MSDATRREHLRAYLLEAMRDRIVTAADLATAPSRLTQAIAADARAVVGEMLASAASNATAQLAARFMALASEMGKR